VNKLSLGRPSLLSLTFGIALFFAGLWIGHRMAATGNDGLPVLPATESAAASHEQEIVQSIETLADEIRRLREEIGSRSSASDTRVPADRTLSDLTRRTQTLEALLERMIATQGASGSGHSAPLSLRDLDKSPGFPSRADLFHDADELVGSRPPEDSSDTKAWEAWVVREQAARARWTQVHTNWSIEQVVERYGQPDSVENYQSGLSLLFVGQQSDGSPATFSFSTQNGLVLQVLCEGKGL
jgi:hypothetical protein